ncbi:MAG: hypothetical protein GY927_00825 [bacterium]|nr:hypothetical protein [bacterium]
MNTALMKPLAVFLVEHNVIQSQVIANRARVMENGCIMLSGTTADLIDNPDLKNLIWNYRNNGCNTGRKNNSTRMRAPKC